MSFASDVTSTKLSQRLTSSTVKELSSLVLRAEDVPIATNGVLAPLFELVSVMVWCRLVTAMH